MSLFSKIGSQIGKIAGGIVKHPLTAGINIASMALPIPGGGVVGTLAKGAVRAGISAATVRGAVRSLPALGKIAVAGAAAEGAVEAVKTIDGHIVHVKKKKKRGKGITAKDLSSFKRVARLVDKFSKPVHHMRNYRHKTH